MIEINIFLYCLSLFKSMSPTKIFSPLWNDNLSQFSWSSECWIWGKCKAPLFGHYLL